MLALALAVAIATPTPDWKKGIDPELLEQNDRDATEIIQKIVNEGKPKDGFKYWGYATGLALMLAGEFAPMLQPKPVGSRLHGGVSSRHKLQMAWPNPISMVGLFVFTFSLGHGRADETRTDGRIREP